MLTTSEGLKMAKVMRYETYLEQLQLAITDDSFPDAMQKVLLDSIPTHVSDDHSMVKLFRSIYSLISRRPNPILLAEQKRSQFLDDLIDDASVSRRLQNKLTQKCRDVQFTLDDNTDPYDTFIELLTECQKSIEQHNKIKAAAVWVGFGLFVFMTLGLGLFALKKMQQYTEKLNNLPDYVGQWSDDTSAVMRKFTKKHAKTTQERIAKIRSVEQLFYDQCADALGKQAHEQLVKLNINSAGQIDLSADSQLSTSDPANHGVTAAIREHIGQQYYSCLDASCTLFRNSTFQHPILRYRQSIQFIDSNLGYAKLPVYTENKHWPKSEFKPISINLHTNLSLSHVIEVGRDQKQDDNKKLYLQITENKGPLQKGYYTYHYKTYMLERIDNVNDVLNKPVEHHGIKGFLGIVDVVDSRSNDTYNYDISYLAMLPQLNEHLTVVNKLSIDPWSRHAKFSNGNIIMPSFIDGDADRITLTLYDMTKVTMDSKGRSTPTPIQEYKLVHEHQILPISIAVSHDEQVVAALFYDRSIAFWEVATGKLLNNYYPSLQGSKKSDVPTVFFWKSIRFDEHGNVIISECLDSRYSDRHQILPYHVDKKLNVAPEPEVILTHHV